MSRSLRMSRRLFCCTCVWYIPTVKPQQKILQFIREFLDDHQMPPTLREIQEHMGFAAIGTVQYHLKGLTDGGLIDVKPRLSRGISLTQRAVGIPIIGRVPAGP